MSWGAGAGLGCGDNNIEELSFQQNPPPQPPRYVGHEDYLATRLCQLCMVHDSTMFVFQWDSNANVYANDLHSECSTEIRGVTLLP